jgi:hypothetical protein
MSEREISPLEDKLLGQAVANTEQEIFRSAMDQAEPDEAEEGDRSREELGEGLEGQHEAEVAEDGDEAEEGDADAETDGEEEAAEAAKPKPEAKPEANQDRDDKGKFVPRSRLNEEASKRREVEETARVATERASKLESDLAALNKRLDDLLARPAPQPQPVAAKVEPAAPAPKPDMFAEPEKYEAWVLEQARANAASEMGKVVTERFVSASMADAHETHGDEFVKAYENLTGINPVTQQVVRQIDRTDPVRMGEIQRVINAPNPGRALMNWQRQQATLQRVGSDPAKFEEGIRNETREALKADPEFRKELLAALRAEAATADNGRPRNVTRFPKSLTDVSGGQSAQQRDPSDYDNSEEGIFEGVWNDRRTG